MKVRGFTSDSVCSSIGLPQGCVLSPIVFILYAKIQYVSKHLHNCFIVKFTDNTVIVRLLQKDEVSHCPIVDNFIQWCDNSNLLLDVGKTKAKQRTRPLISERIPDFPLK